MQDEFQNENNTFFFTENSILYTQTALLYLSFSFSQGYAKKTRDVCDELERRCDQKVRSMISCYMKPETII